MTFPSTELRHSLSRIHGKANAQELISTVSDAGGDGSASFTTVDTTTLEADYAAFGTALDSAYQILVEVPASGHTGIRVNGSAIASVTDVHLTHFGGSFNVTTSTGTALFVSALRITSPTVTVDSGSVSVAAGLYVPAAASGATANYSAFFGGDVALAGGSDLTFIGTTGQSQIIVTANLADAMSVTDGVGDLIVFDTRTGARVLTLMGGVGGDNVQVASTLGITGITTPTGGIAAGGGFSASPRNCHTGGVPAQVTTEGTNSASNTAGAVYLAEVFVPCNCTVTGIAIFNGTAVAGNGKVMLFDSSGNRLGISASTAMSGTTAYQSINLTAPLAVKGPATYYVGAIYDDTTHDLRGHVLGAFGAGTDTGNTYETESTYATVTVPTTFTTAVGPIASLY